MIFEHSREDEVGVIKLVGQLTASNSKQLRLEFKRVCNGEAPKLILDIAELSFVDSTGLGVLVGWLQKIRSEEGEMVLLNPKPEIKVLLELTRLDQVFFIFDDRQDAFLSLH